MISGADGSSYVLSNTLDIKANHRYTLALLANKTMTITVDDYEDSSESGIVEMVNKSFGIVAEPENLKNGEFYPMLNVIAVEDPALEFNADFTVRSTSDEGIEVAVSGDAGIVEDIAVDKKGLLTRAPYYSNTFSVKFAAGKFASNKEFRTVVRVKDKASAATLDIVVWRSDSPVTPPPPPAADETGGVDAFEDILTVDSEGVLNLDGDGKVVYFKWGSLTAFSSGTHDDVFDINDIAWTPSTHYYAALKAAIGTTTGRDAWSQIPYSTGDAITVDIATGLGDPCALAMKDGVAGGYRLPTGNPYEGFTDAGWDASTYSIAGRKSSTSTPFYPAAGYRTMSGLFTALNVIGCFWTSTPNLNDGNRYIFSFNSSWPLPSTVGSPTNGYAIRCVKNAE